jgi:hypothetical protein
MLPGDAMTMTFDEQRELAEVLRADDEFRRARQIEEASRIHYRTSYNTRTTAVGVGVNVDDDNAPPGIGINIDDEPPGVEADKPSRPTPASPMSTTRPKPPSAPAMPKPKPVPAPSIEQPDDDIGAALDDFTDTISDGVRSMLQRYDERLSAVEACQAKLEGKLDMLLELLGHNSDGVLQLPKFYRSS